MIRPSAWLERATRRHPDRIALDTPEGALSYAELAELAARGGEGGAVRPLALAGGLEFAIELHRAWFAGACAMPIDVRLGAHERPSVPPEAGRAVVVIHTSGSTGEPKPVLLTAENLVWSALGSSVALGLDPEERWLCALPVSHVGGLSILVRSAIYGTTAVLHPRFDTAAVLEELMSPNGATLVSLVPTTLARLLDGGLERPPRLRCALIGGGPVAPALMERARMAGVPVRQTYGLSEAASQVTTQPLADRGAAPGDAGPPLFCTAVAVAEDGEILVRGPTVAPSAAGRDGTLATGDLGALDERGRLSVIGRKADTIVTGGENVAPAEVEAVLLEHPGVAEAAVHPRPDPVWGEAVVAAVVARDRELPPTEQELRDHAAARLAAYKVPKEVRLVESLPRTPSGKLRRSALR